MKYLVDEADFDTINAAYPAGYMLGYKDDLNNCIYDDDVGQPGGFKRVAMEALGLAVPSDTDPQIETAWATWLSTAVELDEYRMYDLLYEKSMMPDPHKAPWHLCFKTSLTQRLHPNNIFIMGELQETTYYRDFDGTNFGHPVVKEVFSYVRNAQGFALYRTQTVNWYMKNGQLGPDPKIMVKYYNSQEAIQEGKRRRGNVIDQAMMMVAGMLLATETTGTDQEKLDKGRDLMEHYQADIIDYIEAGRDDLMHAVAADTQFPWLNNVIDGNGTTIRDATVANLDIWTNWEN